MSRAVWNTLRDEVEALHHSHDQLRDFCPFPDDVTVQDFEDRHLPPSDMLQTQNWEVAPEMRGIVSAVTQAAPLAFWRENYKDSGVPLDFLTRFGCYCLIGTHAPFKSEKIAAFFVYMPARLHYPWHHHPAEEAYVVLAGEADFHVAGRSSKTCGQGAVIAHETNQPHSMTTFTSPVLAYVVWRNWLTTRPVLTPGLPQVVP